MKLFSRLIAFVLLTVAACDTGHLTGSFEALSVGDTVPFLPTRTAPALPILAWIMIPSEVFSCDGQAQAKVVRGLTMDHHRLFEGLILIADSEEGRGRMVREFLQVERIERMSVDESTISGGIPPGLRTPSLFLSSGGRVVWIWESPGPDDEEPFQEAVEVLYRMNDRNR